ncbi:unnamed protein product, partial [Brugia timori]|uniref:G_PROTEIN_RECEP_F1_2 domain-containing protein n=1 Tax=Brugia timori TaxID=42155 RepID=A0A0R3R8B1_9BILA
KSKKKLDRKHRRSRRSSESSFLKEDESSTIKKSSKDSRESKTQLKESEALSKDSGSSSAKDEAFCKEKEKSAGESEISSNVSDMQDSSSCQTDDKLMNQNKESRNDEAIVISNEKRISLTVKNSRELSSQTSPIALIPGCFANVSFYGSLLLNLLIAVNRYCALTHPLKYHSFWSVQKARIAAIIAYFLGFLPCFPSIFEPCTLIFNMELDLRWSYSNTSCGYINSMFDLIFCISTLTTAGCINFITLFRIRNYSKSCASGFTIMIVGIFFNVGPHFLTNKWALFAATTICWQLSNTLDG